MTGPERLYALTQAVRHVVQRDVPGDLVECGVWRGGSVLAMILTLQDEGVDDRDLWLYDTFTGMTKPSEVDTSEFGRAALESWKETADGERLWSVWFDEKVFNRAIVEALIESTGYPMQRVHFVEGKVEDTIPEQTPERLALLRLDTDWYESTSHELLHLYPRLSQSGVLIIDDYGHWDGARQAVDEYFASGAAPPVMLTRVDYSCRVAIKV